ncbi:MAG: glucose 1-dehydrogenase, partial [Cyclobacteriaceae bacterium]|nr:glucose 1-dehydrogenase [Cyclobacteriaceae bacterium]
MNQKTAIITGGAQGIGKGIALHFATKNIQVILADRDGEAGQETESLISQTGQALFVKCDVSRPDEARQLMEFVHSAYGRIDYLINNAGISVFRPLESITPEQFDEVLDTNLRAPFLCSQYAAPYLSQNAGASIVNIASTRALMSEPGSEAYAASKGGLLSLTHALAVSLGPGVRVNAISPGWIEVRDWQKKATKETVVHSPEDIRQHPAGKIGNPMDVAKAAWFLCSDDASFITGQNLV